MNNDQKPAKPALSRKDIVKILISAVLTAGLLAVLIKNISVKDTLELIGRLDMKIATLSFIPYLICYFCRALRFKFFIADEKITIKKLVVIHTIHNMCNQLFPANLGELTYLYLLKHKAKIRFAESASSLILARVSDFAVIMAMFLVSCFFLHEKVFAKIKFFAYGTAVILVMIVLGYFLFMRFGKPELFNRQYGGFAGKILNKINYVLSELIQAMRKTHSPARLSGGLVFSALAMNCLYVFYWLIMQSAGIKVNYFEIIFLSSILVPLILLPVKGIAGFGTQEAGWTVGFLILGFGKHIAILTGFAIHITTLVFTIILGVFGMAVIKKCFKGQ